MTRHWTLDDIPWDEIDREKVDPELLQTVKAAALVEANSQDYVTYLHNVFAGDEDFSEAASHWGFEERQHGDALGKWAELVDPDAWPYEGSWLTVDGDLAVAHEGVLVLGAHRGAGPARRP